MGKRRVKNDTENVVETPVENEVVESETVESTASESSAEVSPETRRPNDENKNEIEVTTQGNTVTLDPALPADQTAVVNLEVNAHGIKQNSRVIFQQQGRKTAVEVDTIPELVDGLVKTYATESIQVVVDTKKFPATTTGEKFKLATDNTDIEITEFTNPGLNGQTTVVDGAWLLTSKTQKPVTGKLTVSHADYESVEFKAEFIDPKLKPVIKYQVMNDENNAQVGIPFALRAWCDHRPVSIEKINSNSIIQVIGANTAGDLNVEGVEVPVTTTTFEITFRSPGRHDLELRNADGEARLISFDAYELEVGEYMKLNNKTLELRRGEEKYILGEVMPIDSDTTLESDAAESGAISATIRANRIYVTGIKTGEYTVKVRSKRYKTSEFKVIVLDEDMPTPVVEAAKEYHDLGTPPSVTLADVTVDNFMDKVLALTNSTKEKLCYVVSQEDFINYKMIADSVCMANADLASGDMNRCLKGAGTIQRTLKLVIEQEDYFIFKQLYLAVRLAFEHYANAGLKEDNILYYSARLDDMELVSQMLKFIKDDIDNKLHNFNVANMTDKISFRSKDRLVRYVRELP